MEKKLANYTCSQLNEKSEAEGKLSNYTYNLDKNKETKKENIILIPNIVYSSTEDVDKKNDKRISSKIFDIHKTSRSEKKKELYKTKRKKIGYLIKKKSKRPSNIEAMIVRNLIQEIILDWINNNEIDKKNKLQKIEPLIFKKTNYFNKNKNKVLEYFYKSKITKKTQNQDHNKIIIKEADNEKKIKLGFTLMESFTSFMDVNSREKILISKKPELKNEEEEKKKAYIKNFFEGLKSKEEYINEKGSTKEYQQKFEKKLDELFDEKLI
jgi:hypothetical protein